MKKEMFKFVGADCQGSEEDVHQVSIKKMKRPSGRAIPSPSSESILPLIRPIFLDDTEFGRGPLEPRLF